MFLKRLRAATLALALFSAAGAQAQTNPLPLDINVGVSGNDHSGDSARVAFQKVQAAVNALLRQKMAPGGIAVLDGASKLVASQLPFPGASTLGAVLALSAPAHQFQTGISTAGLPVFAQPGFSDLSGTIAGGQIASGTITGAHLANGAAAGNLGFAPASSARTIVAGTGLTGGGDLTADRTFALSDLGTAGTYGSASSVPVLTTDSKGRISTVSPVAITPSSIGALASAGGTVSGGLNIGTSTASAAFNLNGPAGAFPGTYLQKAGVNRWLAALNTDDSFSIFNYNSSGVLQGTPFQIDNATGVAKGVSPPNSASGSELITAGWFRANSTGGGGGGGGTVSSVSVTSSVPGLTVSGGPVTSSGTLNLTGSLSTLGAVAKAGDTGIASLNFAPNANLGGAGTSNVLTLSGGATYNSGGSIALRGSASSFNPGGLDFATGGVLRGRWADTGTLDFTTNPTVGGVPLMSAAGGAFTGTVTGPSISANQLESRSNSYPVMQLSASGNSTDQKIARFYVDPTGALNADFASDGLTSASGFLTVTRSGVNPAAMNFTAPSINFSSLPNALGSPLFSAAGGTISGPIKVDSAYARIAQTTPGAGANQKGWDSYISADGTLRFRTFDDADTTAAEWLTVARSGLTPTAIDFKVTPSVNGVPIASAGYKTSVSPEDYGAAGDGSTDDTTAVQTAINSGKPVVLTKLYNTKGITFNSNSAYNITGSGRHTGLVLSGTGHGVVVNLPTVGSPIGSQHQLVMRDLVLMPANQNENVALYNVCGGAASGSSEPQIRLDNVHIIPNATSNYYRYGILFSNCRNVYLTAVTVFGQYGNLAGEGIRFDASVANANPVEFNAWGVQTAWFDKGIRIKSYGAAGYHDAQGIKIFNHTALACATGIEAISVDGTSDLIVIQGSHALFSKYGYNLQNWSRPFISDNFLLANTAGNFQGQVGISNTTNNGAYQMGFIHNNTVSFQLSDASVSTTRIGVSSQGSNMFTTVVPNYVYRATLAFDLASSVLTSASNFAN